MSGLGYHAAATDSFGNAPGPSPTSGGLDPAAYLKRFGWTGAGQGLGKTNSGISTFVKVVKKEDNHGIGPRQDWHTSWDDVFNKASRNISVEVGGEHDEVKVHSTDSKHNVLQPDVSKMYGSFVSSNKSLQMDLKKGVDPICAGVDSLASIKGGHHMYCERVAAKLKRLEAQEAGLPSPSASTVPMPTPQSGTGSGTEASGTEREFETEEARRVRKALRKKKRKERREQEKEEREKEEQEKDKREKRKKKKKRRKDNSDTE